MKEQIMSIVWNAIGLIVTGLVSYAVAAFTQWINTKVKDLKVANYLSSIMMLVGNCVNEVSQTYTNVLKSEGKFDKEAQEKALNMCLDKIKTQCAPDVIDFITKNFGDIDDYLKTLIESTIFTSKK